MKLVHEVSRFSMVGATAFVVDLAIFNLLIAVGVGPLTSKTAAVVAATTVAYLLNRRWTFAHRGAQRDRIGQTGEYALFFALNGVGLLITLACLGVGYYVLGFTSVLAQNVAANGVGLVLGMLFRFWAYRRFVFPERPEPVETEPREPEFATTTR